MSTWVIPIPDTPPTSSTNIIEVINSSMSVDPDNPGGYIWGVIQNGIFLDNYIHPGLGSSYTAIITAGGSTVAPANYTFDYQAGTATFTTQKTSQDSLNLLAYRLVFLRGGALPLPDHTIPDHDTDVTAEQLDELTGGEPTSLHSHPYSFQWHYVGFPTEPAFQNSWVNYGTPYPNASFGIDLAGTVWLQGLIKDGTLNMAAFTLPVGYRPANTITFATIANDGSTVVGRLSILSTGAVAPIVGGNTWFSIQCCFPAEQ